jgi:hypothetical protein
LFQVGKIGCAVASDWERRLAATEQLYLKRVQRVEKENLNNCKEIETLNISNVNLRKEVKSLKAALGDMKSKYEGEGQSSVEPSLDPKQLELEINLLKEKLKGMFAIFLHSQT